MNPDEDKSPKDHPDFSETKFFSPGMNMRDSGFGPELMSPAQASGFVREYSEGGVFKFDEEMNEEAEMEGRGEPAVDTERNLDIVETSTSQSSARSRAISIPNSIPRTSQRHTNFTPPRIYPSGSSSNPPGGSSPMEFLLHINNERLATDMTIFDNRPPAAFSFHSEPNFRRHVERQIGHELRTISDTFHIQQTGFGFGYQFSQHPQYYHNRTYSESYPGAAHKKTLNWQGVIQNVSPTQKKPPPNK